MESARASTPQGHTSKEEWRSSAKVCYGPEEVVSQGLSREAAGDVEDVVQIEIAPSGVSVTYLSADLRANARKLEEEFGPRPRPVPAASRRAERRTSAAQRQERERNSQQWRARLRDRAPASGLGVHITHNTVTVSQSSSVD